MAVHLRLGNDQNAKVNHLKLSFADLVVTAHQCLKADHPDAETTALRLNEILRGSRDEPLVIEGRVENYSDLFCQLQAKWSFTTPILLQQLVEMIKNDSLTERMETYMTNYRDFCRSFTKLNEQDEQVVLEEHDSASPALF